MNCVEFERILLEDGRIPEQQAHLDSCSVCASLLADLDFISSQAKSLVALNEPSPAVWNAIEAQLRREGLIRAPQISEPRISEPRIDFFQMVGLHTIRMVSTPYRLTTECRNPKELPAGQFFTPAGKLSPRF